jgi:hypothetical protein
MGRSLAVSLKEQGGTLVTPMTPMTAHTSHPFDLKYAPFDLKHTPFDLSTPLTSNPYLLIAITYILTSDQEGGINVATSGVNPIFYFMIGILRLRAID